MDTLFYHTTQDLCKNQRIEFFSFYSVHFLFFLAKKEEKTESKEKKNAVVFYIFADAQMWFVIGVHPIIHARYGSLRSHACENSAASVRQSRDSERKSAGLPAAAV